MSPAADSSQAPSTLAPVVLKFGGAALADGPGIRRVGSILASRGGARPIAVVSAAAGVTELLLQVAAAAAEGRWELERVRVRHRSLLSQCGLDPELLNRMLAELASVLEGIRERRKVTPAERDFVLSFGERMSARVVAAALRAGGRDATPVDAFDLGLISDSNHGRARPIVGTGAAIRRALAEVPGVPVVTGFVAKDAAGNLTTLGRNGSDLSASLLAEACGAREVQFWKVVGGVMSADPSMVPDARPLARLSYMEAAEYAFRGANVLHPGALEPLERSGIPARVLCFADPDGEGTWIGPAEPRAEEPTGPAAVGVTLKRGAALVRVDVGALEDRSRRVGEFQAELARADVEPLWLASGPRELSLICVWSDELASLLSRQTLPVAIERALALVALVGPNANSVEAAARALEEAAIEVRVHWAETGGAAAARVPRRGSEARDPEPERSSAVFVVSEALAPSALRAVHSAVFQARMPLPTGF